ncbi:hypothetical protein [Actinoplanes solisilvae]|uniref:hypothetical protein n=1 Tax=Actinoplanes solisilvae TaxID=2486853 RepID=UPI000FDB5EDF|nr:hypothetical protein [Actinoplanes solisilvae]
MRKIVAILSAALLTIVLDAAPARAAGPEVEILWTLLVAKGAAVDVSYGVTCPEDTTGTVTVSIAQVRDDGLLAGGTTTEELDCGALAMARVTASVLGAPFERGRASLSMLVTGGPPFTANVRLTKG